MSAKSKKRLCKLENKLLKLDKLQLKDVICTICQSILIEPVTLPCFHDFCQRCFKGTIENNALCCPLCRLRIGSWLRTATKRNGLVNAQLWEFLNFKFSREIATKLQGDDLDMPEEKPLPRLSVPGEIRSEYEAELQRLRDERMKQELKHIKETEILIEKIQQEERESQRHYIERLKQDELLARKMQKQESSTTTSTIRKRKKLRQTAIKLKVPKIDSYLAKLPDIQKESETSVRGSSLLTDDRSTDDRSTDNSPAKSVVPPNSIASPEVVPSYTSLIKNYFNKKLKTNTGVWNKENGKKEEGMEQEKSSEYFPKMEITFEEVKKKGVVKSLLVSLPLPNSSILQQKTNPKSKTADSDSVDSMKQELCFFKPIEKISSNTINKVIPLRVPSVRAAERGGVHCTSPPPRNSPSRTDFIDSLCTLRQHSLTENHPSAFVLALSILKKNTTQSRKSSKIKVEKLTNNSPDSSLRRRTRSMGSTAKDENETTPKKKKLDRKAQSDRKPHLRSATKKSSEKKAKSPLLTSKTLNNNKVNVAIKNLSSPLNNCDVKQILQEQLRIEKIIEQEKKDLELARKMDAEWNGRRQLRQAPSKRQATFNYALRPAKKVKV